MADEPITNSGSEGPPPSQPTGRVIPLHAGLPPERFKQLERLLKPRPGQPDPWQVEDTFYLQAEAAVLLAQSWDMLSDFNKTEFTRLLSERVPRCRDAARPELLMLQILKLPCEEDILRALQVRPKSRNGHRDYMWTDQELVYREPGGWISRYIDYAKGNYIPMGFHFWTAIAALGAVCKRNVYFDAGQFSVLSNWYIMLVGDKATGKSAAAGVAVDLLDRVNRQLCPSKNELERLPFGRQFINCLPNDVTKQRIISKLSSLRYNPKPFPYTDEITGMACTAGPDLPVDATAFIFFDELANFLGRQSYNATDNVAFLTQIKESSKYEKSKEGTGEKDTKRDHNLYNLAVSMLACCAPAWLKEVISPTILGGGFMDRTTYVYRDPVWDRVREYSPFQTQASPRDPIVGERLATELRQVAEIERRVVPDITPEARDLGESLYRQLISETETRYLSAGNSDDITTGQRAFNDVLKMALMLAVSDAIGTLDFPKMTINKDHMELAYRLIRSEETSMRRFLARSQESSAMPIETRLRERFLSLRDKDRCVTRTEMVRNTMKGYRVDQIIPAAKQLVEEGVIRVLKNKTGGQMWAPADHKCEKCSDGIIINADELKW